MTNDGKRAYVANLLDHTIRCLSVAEAACPTPQGAIVDTYLIDLRQNYDKISGEKKGPYGLSPIQLPISPDDSYMLVVGTFSGNILQIDMKTNKIVKEFPCGPGCHGINFGAKKGGGYLGYVSVKFNNLFWVIDGDPNSDGDLSDGRAAGAVLTSGTAKMTDDTPVGLFGQGARVSGPTRMSTTGGCRNSPTPGSPSRPVHSRTPSTRRSASRHSTPATHDRAASTRPAARSASDPRVSGGRPILGALHAGWPSPTPRACWRRPTTRWLESRADDEVVLTATQALRNLLRSYV